jgi:MATE family multidrug resistance protein
LIWAVISPLVSVWCFPFGGIFIGVAKGPEMRNSMVFSAVAVFLAAWNLLQPLGNYGSWLAFLLFFADRGVSMGWYFVKIERAGGFT